MNSIMQRTRLKLSYVAGLLTIALLLASCGTSRKTGKGGTADGTAPFSTVAHVSTVIGNNSTAKAITAKIKAKLSLPSDNISTSGTLRMKRGEVIQVSLVDPILGITEVVRIEFTKDKVLIIDRLGRRYLEEPYSKVDFLQKAGISFNMLESLFWNELFQPGKTEIDAKNFSLKAEESDLLTIGFKDKYLDYSFVTERSSGKLRQTSISTTNSLDYSLNFVYDDFKEFCGQTFPYSETLQFASADGKLLELSLRMSGLKSDSDWSASTKVSSRYQKLDAETLLKSLISR